MFNKTIEIKQKVSALLQIAIENEPSITNDLLEISKNCRGLPIGLENRYKTSDSLFRKLNQYFERTENFSKEFLDEVSQNINDILRYTIVFEVEKYTDNSLLTIAKLKEINYQIGKIWNAWLTADSPRDFGYRGINITIYSPGKQIFELQFHTPESYTAKEAGHHLYEQMRLAKTIPEIRKRVREKQIQNVSNLKVPPNINKIR